MKATTNAVRAAVYARFSTDKQRDASIEDQLRECERAAQAAGLEVVARFEDRGISAGTSERPGYQALLAAARRREVDIIVTEDISRLWRNRAEFGPRSAELEDLGVHWLSCVGQDTRRDGWGLVIQILQAMAEQQRREASYRTRRGLEGRARAGKSAGGRAYGYIAACDSASGQREVHPEQAETVRRIFGWYADGKSARWIAARLNEEGVPSPGSLWNRTSKRLNAKRTRAWVFTAIHGDRARGTGILNNRAYIGEVVWNRSTWKRSAADSKQRRWRLNDASELVVHKDERLRIVAQELWDAVKARQQAVERMAVRVRGALKGGGPVPRHLLSGLLVCQTCGGAFRRVNSREYGCATYKDGGAAACTNSLRVPGALAEARLLDRLVEEMLSVEGVALLEKRIREHVRKASQSACEAPKPQAPQVARKQAEIEQLRSLMKAGTLSQAVAQVAIEKAEEEIRAIERLQPARDERDAARVIRMLPKAAELLRQRIRGENLGLRDPRSIVQGRNTLYAMFGGKVQLRPAEVADGEKPYLIARVGLDRSVLLETAGSCLQVGSGGRI